MIVLSDKMDKEIEDVTADINAYQACLQRMEKESYNILSETDFQKDKQKVTMSVADICWIVDDNLIRRDLEFTIYFYYLMKAVM
jgi:hypothetical protein